MCLLKMQDNQFIREILSTAEGGTVKYNNRDVRITMFYNYYGVSCHNSDYSMDVMNYYSYEDTKMCFEIVTNDDYTKYEFGGFYVSVRVGQNMSTIILIHEKTCEREIFKYDHSSYSLSNFIVKTKQVFEMLCNQTRYRMTNPIIVGENILSKIIDEYIRIMDRRNTKNANY